MRAREREESCETERISIINYIDKNVQVNYVECTLFDGIQFIAFHSQPTS